MSHNPSPSTSPEATPAPLSRLAFIMRARASVLVNWTPVACDESSVKPGAWPSGLFTMASRYTPFSCHDKGSALAKRLAKPVMHRKTNRLVAPLDARSKGKIPVRLRKPK